MKKTFHSLQRGQTLVEFALILPVFLFLVVVIFDFGRAVYYYSTINNAAREGARFGVVNPTNYGGMVDAAKNYAIGLGTDNLNVTAGPGTTEWVGDEEAYTVKVTVNYCFVPVTPLVGEFIPENECSTCPTCKSLLLTSEAIMRTEIEP